MNGPSKFQALVSSIIDPEVLKSNERMDRQLMTIESISAECSARLLKISLKRGIHLSGKLAKTSKNNQLSF